MFNPCCVLICYRGGSDDESGGGVGLMQSRARTAGYSRASLKSHMALPPPQQLQQRYGSRPCHIKNPGELCTALQGNPRRAVFIETF